MDRSFFSSRIEQLEALARDHSAPLHSLHALQNELKFRHTWRALKLRKDLARRIAEFDNLAGKSHPPPQLPETNSNLGVKLTKFNLSTRAANVMRAKGVVLVGDLCKLTESELLRLPGMGRKTINELRAILSSLGLQFGMNISCQIREIPETPKQALLPLRFHIDEPADLPGALKAHVMAAAVSERNVGWTIAHLGWDGAAARTLEAIGRPEKITRERVRQIVAKCCIKMGEREIVPGALGRAIKLIDRNAPVTQSRLDALLQESGLANASFDVVGIKRAADVFGVAFPFFLFDGFAETLVLRREQAKLPSEILRTVKLEVSAHGCVIDDQLSEIARQSAGEEVELSFVQFLLESEGSFARLDGCDDWWWRPTKARVGRNRLVNTITKVLAACAVISLSELRDACRRHVRSNHIAPPTRALGALCASTSFLKVINGRVERVENALRWEAILNPSERLLLEIFARRGPVLDSYTVSEEGISLGLNENSITIYKTYSPLLWRPVPGYLAVVGREIPIGLIDELERKKSRPKRSVIEFGWTKDHKVLLVRRVTEGIWLSGIVSIPSALQAFIQGNFTLSAVARHDLRTITVRDNNAFGFRSFLRMFGGEVGDALIMVFDPQSRTCAVWLGGHEIINVSRLGPDAVVTHLSGPNRQEEATK